MPAVRYTGGATYSLRDGPNWTEGDVHDVGERTADRLTDRHDFEVVTDDGSESADSDEFAVSDAHPLADDIDSRNELHEEMIATVESGTVPEVTDAVEAGQYDGHLDMLVEVEAQFGDDRVGVQDAINDRRNEQETNP